jgi:catechol 2,3-dioxygenase-like lactoylglutathione lyase family enzyme
VTQFIPGFQEVHHVAVTVSDVERALAFYRDLLGFPLVGVVTFAGEPGLIIHFLDAGGNALLEMFSFATPAAVPSDFLYDDRQIGFRHLAFKVQDVDAVAARLLQAGVEFTLMPLDAVGGVRIAFFKDPDGTLVEIVAGTLDYHVWGEAPQPVAIPARGAPAGSELAYDHVALTVADLRASLAFYQDVLGLPLLGELHFEDERGFRIAYLQLGNSVLELFAFDVPTLPRAANPPVTVLGLKHLALLVDDVDAVAAQLAARGAQITNPPRDVRGVRNCFFVDPDGNVLELIDGTPASDPAPAA